MVVLHVQSTQLQLGFWPHELSSPTNPAEEREYPHPSDSRTLEVYTNMESSDKDKECIKIQLKSKQTIRAAAAIEYFGIWIAYGKF